MRKKDFDELLESIGEARRIHAGELKSRRVVKFDPVAVKRIRKTIGASQSQFACMIGVSVDTLQNWEQGRRRPEGPALALLKVAEADPKTVFKSLCK